MRSLISSGIRPGRNSRHQSRPLRPNLLLPNGLRVLPLSKSLVRLLYHFPHRKQRQPRPQPLKHRRLRPVASA